MITLDITPKKVVPAKNPVRIFGATDNYVEEEAAEEVVNIQFTSPTTSNPEVWKWKYGELVFMWEWVAAPDNSGYQMLADATALDEAELRALMENCPMWQIMNASIVLLRVGPYWNLTIHKKHGEFELEFIEGTYPSSIINASIDDHSSPRIVKSDFRIVALLFNHVVDLFGWWKINQGQIDASPDDNSKFNLNIASPLQSMVEWFMPELNSSAMAPCPGMAKSYLIRLLEVYYNGTGQIATNPLNLFPDGDTEQKWIALHSRMPLSEFSPNNFEDNYITLSENKRFLTHRPRTSLIFYKDPVFLYYYVPDDMDVILSLQVYLADGTTATTSFSPYSASVNDDQYIHYVAVGIANNPEIAAYLSNKDVVKYKVWLEDDLTNKISETFTFVIEDRDYDNYNYLLFESALGGLDTLRIKGDVAIANTHEGEELQLAQKEIESKDFFQMSNNINQFKYVINTGFFNRIEDIEWAEQVAASPNVYLLMGDKLIKLIVEKTEHPLHSISQSLYSLTITAKRAHYDRT